MHAKRQYETRGFSTAFLDKISHLTLHSVHIQQSPSPSDSSAADEVWYWLNVSCTSFLPGQALPTKEWREPGKKASTTCFGTKLSYAVSDFAYITSRPIFRGRCGSVIARAWSKYSPSNWDPISTFP